jgi:hypothetical protein
MTQKYISNWHATAFIKAVAWKLSDSLKKLFLCYLAYNIFLIKLK